MRSIRCLVFCSFVIGPAGCGGGTQVLCDCALGGTSVILSDGVSATAIDVSGACDAEDLSCASGGDRESCVTRSYFIVSTRAGTCHLEVELEGGAVFARDLRFERSDGCCEGYYPVPGDHVVTVEAP